MAGTPGLRVQIVLALAGLMALAFLPLFFAVASLTRASLLSEREQTARLATAARMTWATEHLPCSAFWDRIDSCPTSRLDHMLTTLSPSETRAAGGCAEVGCATQDRCPLYEEHVSDHCPVVVTFAR